VAALLRRIDWAAVNRATKRQIRNREVHCPPISLFRWWARRPHALTGALLDASKLRSTDLVSDPFSGGGTVTIEAVVRGHRVYAQDLNPWPTWGLQTALDGVTPETLKAGIDWYWKKFRLAVAKEYSAKCPQHGLGEILNTFWVRKCQCKSCRRNLFLFPYSLITLASRNERDTNAFFGCAACGHVTKGKKNRRVTCHQCRRVLAAARYPLLFHKIVQCPHCSREIPYHVAWSSRPKWKSVLVQRLCMNKGKSVVHFNIPTSQEKKAACRRIVRVARQLSRPIPKGKETAVLHRGGLSRWRDLYPPRQIRVMQKAVELVQGCSSDAGVRRRIQLAIAGTAEMAGYLCRWDRFHPKPFEALANHRYAVLGLAVETNIAAERGRGTLKRRLMGSIRAAKWAQENISDDSQLTEKRKTIPFTIVTGNSAQQRVGSNSVKLVITDPPYYDAVQYGELSELFLVWARIITGRKRMWKPNLDLEAVPNSVRKIGAQHYQLMLRSILIETARTMRPSGRLLLTYHSTDFRGWFALGCGLRDAGLKVVALAVAHSENEKDHCKRNSSAFSTDLVIECEKKETKKQAVAIVTAPRRSEQRELIVAGRVIAELGDERYELVARKFNDLTRRIKYRRIHVPPTSELRHE
jgi:putative DNA methylase